MGAEKRKKKAQNMEELTNIKSAIKESVANHLDMKVSRTIFEEYEDDDGDQILRVDVWLRKKDEEIEGARLGYLIPLIANIVRNSNFKSYPLIIPHLAKEQKIKLSWL